MNQNKYITYSYDFIMKYKDYHNKDDNLLIKFDDIIKVFETSPDYNKNKKIILPSSTKIIKNRWKQTKTNDKIELLTKRINSILNKLTENNFNVLIKKLETTKIVSYEMLETTATIIFNKFITDHFFHNMYSKMIESLSNKPLYFSKDDKIYSFRELLINLSQKEYEKISNINKTRKIGNIILIGEMYNHNLIAHKVIEIVLNKLFDNITIDNIECICKLLTICGKSIEKNNKLMEYMEKLNKIMKSNVESRIKFYIMDLIDLHNNNWIKNIKTTKIIQKNVNILTYDELFSKIKYIIDEYNAIKNIKDVISYLNEINNDQIDNAIKAIIENIYERRENEIDNIIEVLMVYVKTKNIDKNRLTKQIVNILDNIYDVYIDYPNVLKYIVNLINKLNRYIDMNSIISKINDLDEDVSNYLLENIE